MANGSSAQTGFLGALKTLSDSLLGTVQDRLSLFSLELQEEKLRLIRIFLWISTAVFTGMMAVAFGSLTIVYLFWESARIAVLGGLTAVYAAALVWIIVSFRRFLSRQPSPFAATLNELKEDRECILPKT
jgi:uncharacterized membrane protein YqjE